MALLALASAFAAAQEQPKPKANDKKAPPPFAIVFVTVWGTDNRPLYGVPVKLQRTTGKAHWEGTSDHNGEIAFRVPAAKADYVVSVPLSHRKSKDNNNLQLKMPVKVHVEFDERVDTGLHLSK